MLLSRIAASSLYRKIMSLSSQSCKTFWRERPKPVLCRSPVDVVLRKWLCHLERWSRLSDRKWKVLECRLLLGIKKSKYLNRITCTNSSILTRHRCSEHRLPRPTHVRPKARRPHMFMAATLQTVTGCFFSPTNRLLLCGFLGYLSRSMRQTSRR